MGATARTVAKAHHFHPLGRKSVIALVLASTVEPLGAAFSWLALTHCDGDDLEQYFCWLTLPTFTFRSWAASANDIDQYEFAAAMLDLVLVVGIRFLLMAAFLTTRSCSKRRARRTVKVRVRGDEEHLRDLLRTVNTPNWRAMPLLKPEEDP